MKILLTSSGFGGKLVWEKFCDLVKKNKYKSASVVVTAHPKKEKAVWAVETKRQMESIGLDVVFVDFENGYSEIESDVIYVCGGNTYRLLKGAKEVNFSSSLEKLFNRGGLYVGSSAGSLILSPDISSASLPIGDKNEVGLEDIIGLSFIDFHIYAHYDPSKAQSLSYFRKQHKEEIIPLPNGEGIYIEDVNLSYIK